MNPRRLLQKMRQGEVANVRFTDLTRLVETLGFELARIRGSHHLYSHPDIPEILSLQSVRGEAKPYQIRQVLRTMAQHGLDITDS
jgi:predicted RNA binding protein YcfA (HicA-like mRNA interferase family)